MTERVDDGTLEHAPDRVRSNCRVRVFPHGTVLMSPGGQRLPVHRDGIFHEEFDPHGRETHRGWAPRAMGGRLVREEEPGVINRKASDDVPIAVQMPKQRRAECGLVELDCGVPVADGQHGRDLSFHRIDPEHSGFARLRKEAAGRTRLSCITLARRAPGIDGS
jgi:hypothetical protein